MPNIGDAFPSRFLKAGDLHGTEPVVTMKTVKMEQVGQSREMKAVLYFNGKEKGLVLNKTNANKITKIVGSALTEDWRGKRIRLYATETEFGGDTVDCIRIKSPDGQPDKITIEDKTTKPRKRKAPEPPPEPEPDDAIPEREPGEEEERDVDPDDDDHGIPF